MGTPWGSGARDEALRHKCVDGFTYGCAFAAVPYVVYAVQQLTTIGMTETGRDLFASEPGVAHQRRCRGAEIVRFQRVELRQTAVIEAWLSIGIRNLSLEGCRRSIAKAVLSTPFR